MTTHSLRQRYRTFLLKGAHRPALLPGYPAVVFAPHPDDEVLGCGATIALKRRLNIPVTIVFVTDGSRSHRGLMDPQQMRQVRRQEAHAANQVLGVAAKDLRFLDFPNGALHQHLDKAQAAVELVLNELRPQEIYLPAAWDYHAEHTLTNQLVTAALRKITQRSGLSQPVPVFEYPIWFYHQWPWVRLPARGTAEYRRMLLRALRWVGGLAFLPRFRYAVRMEDALGQKHAALSCYASQTGTISNDPNWSSLADVAGGEFLDCFFQEYEIFHRFEIA